jgi:hypothetical protein
MSEAMESQLAAMGFPADVVRAALTRTGNNMERALEQ